MRFSSKITEALYKILVVTLCLAFAGAASSCSELLEDDDPFESTSYKQGWSSSVTSEETVQTEQANA